MNRKGSFGVVTALLFTGLITGTTAFGQEPSPAKAPAAAKPHVSVELTKEDVPSTKLEVPKSDVTKDEETPKVSPLSIPLVEGFPSFGLKLPDLDENGKLRSLFVIGSVSKINDREVKISDSLVETYGEDGAREMSIELPEATLDPVTRVLVAKVPVTIRRAEFEVTGASMEFNTLTREGGLGGPVRMLLYNLDLGDNGSEESKKEPHP